MKYAGIDIGAETIKYAIYDTKTEKIDAFDTIAHHKAMQTAISSILSTLKRLDVDGIAVCGRFANLIKLKNYPAQAVQKRGLAYLYGDNPVTCISIGCNGFSVLEKRPNGADLMRENSRCSQGTGNSSSNDSATHSRKPMPYATTSTRRAKCRADAPSFSKPI